MKGGREAISVLVPTCSRQTSSGNSARLARQRGTGRESGLVAELEQQFQVWTFRGRPVIRFEAFRERAEALDAVGLQE